MDQYLAEVVQSLVEIGMHPCWGLVSNFDGVLQDPLRDDVALWRSCRLCTNEDTEFWVTAFAVLLELLLQRTQPLGHQVNVLAGENRVQQVVFTAAAAISTF